MERAWHMNAGSTPYKGNMLNLARFGVARLLGEYDLVETDRHVWHRVIRVGHQADLNGGGEARLRVGRKGRPSGRTKVAPGLDDVVALAFEAQLNVGRADCAQLKGADGVDRGFVLDCEGYAGDTSAGGNVGPVVYADCRVGVAHQEPA